jgi:hypothetical protein
MDWNIGVGIETQSHSPVLNLEHRDLDHALKAHRSPNYNRFVVFSGQDQHGIASIRVSNRANTKKADVVAHPGVFDHVGLLTDEPPGMAGLRFI